MQWVQLLCEKRIREYQKSTTGNDLRTEFEKDYHRIIGSPSFRRLQDKTQVFPLDKSDYVRTRLTHSLEVSSFAKSLAQSVGEKILQEKKEGFSVQNKQDISDILLCAGLLHDIGNPPFGHFGETTIQDWFKKNLPVFTFQGKPLTEVLEEEMQQDFYHFEGNTQALRVVTKLHFLVDKYGMNLTKALLATIIKYPVSSTEIDKKSGDIRTKKMGYFQADKENFAEIQSACGTNGKRHPLTFLLEAADDIAYKTADIEDSVKKGNINYTQLKTELLTRFQKVYPKKYETLKDLEEELENIKKENVQAFLISELKRKYEKAEKNQVENPDTYAVQNWAITVQGKALQSASECFMENYDQIMEGEYKRDLFYNTGVEHMMKDLGDIAYTYSFITKPIFKLEIAADTIFQFFLNKFVDAAIYYDTSQELTDIQKKYMAIISEDYKKIYHIYADGKGETEKLYLRLLLVTDYVCGMTDSFAKNLYQELNGIQ